MMARAGKDAQVGRWRGRLLGVELGVELCSSSAGASGEAAALCLTTGGTASTGRWGWVRQAASGAAGIPARGARGGGREQGHV